MALITLRLLSQVSMDFHVPYHQNELYLAESAMLELAKRYNNDPSL
jgi:hypothetical protein